MWGNSYDVDDFLRASEEQINQYEMHRDRFVGLARETEDRQSELQNKRSEAFALLASNLLPDISDASSVHALAAHLGLQELVTLHTRLIDQLGKNAFRRKEIETSEEYTNRDLQELRLETRRNELEPLYRHANLEWQKLQSQERLADLIARGYGTEQYPHRGLFRFFNKQFLEDWRCADAACEALGFETFSELRAAYNDRAEQMQVLGRDWNQLQQERHAIEALEQERAQLIQDETTLPQRTYHEMGERIATILDNGKSPLVATLPHPDAIRSRLQELSGIAAQTEYLDGLRNQLDQESATIAERSEKLRQERNRYSENAYRYRNKRFTGEQWDKRFGAHRTARYEPLYGRYRRASDTVYVFNDYNRASGLEDFLWWDVMTDGRLDGNFIPEVREWRDHNPDYRYERYRDRSTSSTDAFESSDFGANSLGSDPS